MGENKRFIAEWEPQSAVMIAWPHKETDWAYMLDEVEECYRNVARAIMQYENLIILTAQADHVESCLDKTAAFKAFPVNILTNDTWCRDFGAIAVENNGMNELCNFKFNAWGNKFQWALDNDVTDKMNNLGLFSCKVNDCSNFILEGGSIETDGSSRT